MSENKIELRAQQVELLEKLAVQLEKKGFQPAMAKVVALLLVNDDPEMTFDQIMETLGISKGAASQAINQLLTAEKIEYRTKLGERKRYFRSRLMSWKDSVQDDFVSLTVFSGLLKQILSQRPASSESFNNNMARLIKFMDFLNAELPQLYKKFEEQES